LGGGGLRRGRKILFISSPSFGRRKLRRRRKIQKIQKKESIKYKN